MTTELYSLKVPSAGPTTGHGKTDTEAQRSETEKPNSSACAVEREGEQGIEDREKGWKKKPAAAKATKGLCDSRCFFRSHLFLPH